MFKKKEDAPITVEEKIAAIQTRVAESMDVFKKAEESVTLAQEELTTIIQNAKQEIDNQHAIIAKAEADYEYNRLLREKLSTFRGMKIIEPKNK